MLVYLKSQEELVIDSFNNVEFYNLLNIEGIYSKTSLIFSVLFTIIPHPKSSFNCKSKLISLEFRDILKLGFTAQTNLYLILLSIQIVIPKDPLPTTNPVTNQGLSLDFLTKVEKFILIFNCLERILT